MPVVAGDIGVLGSGGDSSINWCAGGCIAAQAVICKGSCSAVGVGDAGGVVLLCGVRGMGLQIEAGPIALL